MTTKNKLAILGACLLLLVPLFALKSFIQTAYAPAQNEASDPFKVLIVPGHEPDDGGALYLGRKEREIALAMGLGLKTMLDQNPRFETVLSRDADGWNPVLAEYFEQNKEEIGAWRQEKKDAMDKELEQGSLVESEFVAHNNAPEDTAFRLYGVNKWANENDIDLVIHLHMNDDVRKKRKVPGKYSGFAIYVPERQYDNSAESMRFAELLKLSLGQSFHPSTLPVEEGGIIESQKLIAVGRYRTLDVPGVLVEYGYVYDDAFSEENKEKTISEMALKTYEAFESFRGGGALQPL